VRTIIGYSTGGLPIESYTFGGGPIRVAFVGGIHGGTEWNTVLLAYAAIDYFDRHPQQIPPVLTLQIVPSANPDGLRLVSGGWGRFQPNAVRSPNAAARFNQNGVDLNRNWDCAWAAQAWWGGVETNGGSAPFSERETRVLRDFFLGERTDRGAVHAVVFWHSAVPGVFAGGCDGLYPAAERLAAVYGRAAGYPYGNSFTYYPITGDATNWLSMQQIPAITVELRTRNEAEWPQNLAGMLALLAELAGAGQMAVEEQPDHPSGQPSFAR
jgi:predicted deacylase